MKKHYNRIFNCAFFDDEKTKIAVFVAVKRVQQEVVAVEKIGVAAIEAIKSEICVKNINFFDFTMFLNLLELRISIINASFLHHLIEIAVNYQKKT